MANEETRLSAWVAFDEDAMSLRRLIAPHNIKGFLLTVSNTEYGEQVREKASKFGFVDLKAKNLMRRYFTADDSQLRVSEIAAALGGNVIGVPRAELLGDKWTVDISNRSPSVSPPVENKSSTPDRDTMSILGLNRQGDEVIVDKTGRFLRRHNPSTGGTLFVKEGEGEKSVQFLRASKPEDLDAIASGLVAMSLKGTLHKSDFDRLVDAALEEGPHGKLEMAPQEAAEAIRLGMLRDIAAMAVADDASREAFVKALRVSAAAGFVLSRPTPAGGILSPSPALAAFMRRQSRGQTTVDFRGAEDMKIALPRIQRDDAAFQVHDLGAVPGEGLIAYAHNILARRPVEGRSILRVSGKTGEEDVERLRSALAVTYALEGVGEIAPSVADGFHDGDYTTLFFIGERRPEALDALPQAAMRTFKVETTNDLLNLERDILRARGKIREFHQGVEEKQAAEDDREANKRQMPYQALSRVSEPFTMIPMALEAATRKAIERVRRDFEEQGGVDAVVAAALGTSIDGLQEILTAEQVDAIGMRLNAASRGRGFLLADATGVGKGRSLAAIALAHVRSGPNKKVLYVTESATINAPDVFRDLKDIGALASVKPMFLTAGTIVVDKNIDPVTGLEVETVLTSPKPKTRKNILASEKWPEEYNAIITTYAQMRSKEDDPTALWIDGALDADTLVILDEAHNALNEKSSQGKSIRAAIKRVCNEVGTANVVDGTATPMRDPSGMSLYAPLMPFTAQEGFFDDLLKNIKDGGEIAQETYAEMLARDGVMLRRDHDLSNIEFKVALPDDELMLRYQDAINKFSPVVEMMLESSSRISEHLGRRQAAEFAEALARGLSEAEARAETNEMNQYSISLGSPLANLARVTMNAVKIDQVVDLTLQEIQEGRKPMITFHSTNGGLLDEMSRDHEGNTSDVVMANATGLTLKDQVRRIHQTMYRIKVEGERVDARDLYENVAEASVMIEGLIDELPDNMPVSPIDALIEKLEANGVSVGELSGRTKAYRGGRIVRLSAEQRDKRGNIDAYNAGDVDVLIYNSAGATGGSFHASPKFKDQTPRTMIEWEAPTDPIKYVQGLGRGNRYGQVARPRIVSVVTGLTPEMRILQQRNKKLRSLGASVDGNRSHPMLLDDIPDLLNKVGDEATRNVLLSMPALSRRLGFAEFAEMDENNQRAEHEVDAGSGAGANPVDSLSNKVLARSLVLTAAMQDDLVKRIVMEFDALIEELESRNANPLRPKELEGQVEIKATTIFSGMVTDEDDLDASAFLSPLYISTAIHHFNEEAWNGDKLITEIEQAKRLYGSEGFQPFGERITQNLPMLMRPYLPEGLDMERALENPTYGGARFETRHGRITDLAWILDNLRPGVSIRYPDMIDSEGVQNRTIVGLMPPSNPDHYDIPSAYKIKVISPGMSKAQTLSVSRLLAANQERIYFTPGLSEAYNEAYVTQFDQEALMTRRLPVQILSGNVLQAISEAANHNLGTVSLYRDMEGHVHRGIVVPKSQINLEMLPVQVANGPIGRELTYRFLSTDLAPEGTNDAGLGRAVIRFWGSMDPSKPIPTEKQDAELYISITKNRATIDLVPLRKSTEAFYRDRPGLYEAMHSKPLPAPEDVPARAFRRPGANSVHTVRIDLDSDGARNRVLRIMDRLGATSMLIDAPFRSALNDVMMEIKDVSARPRAFGLPEDDIAPAISESTAAESQDGEEVQDETPAVPSQDEEIDIEQTQWGF